MIENAESPDIGDAERARALYWRALVQLKIDCEYLQRYRDRLAGQITLFRIARAIVSVGALGSWVAGLGYPKLWGGVIVVSQVAEAVQAALPLTARERALRAAVAAFDAVLIDALFEWEEIQLSSFEAREIRRRWHMLLRLKHETEAREMATFGLPHRA